ncbi:MAG: hypothetical protein C4289_10310, partial [Chloroflexota bacterium]
MVRRYVSVSAAQTRLSDLLAEVEPGRGPVIILRRGRPAAALVSVGEVGKHGVLGLMGLWAEADE